MSDNDSFILQPIQCELRRINTSCEEGMKRGRYSGSFHWEVPGFMEKKWIVMGYIDLDWVTMEQQSKSKDEILLGCLMHLNKVPERKKHAKKEPRPRYGKLEPYKADFKLTKEGKPFIIYQFKTDERNNANFRGEGQSYNGEKIGKKRGRPAKIKTDDQTDLIDKVEEVELL